MQNEHEKPLDVRLFRPRTVFYPGHRIKMNIVPMFLNIFVPWFVFVFCCGLCSFWIMYSQPGIVGSLLAFIFVAWAVSLYFAVKSRQHNPEPTWLTYVALMVGVAAISGTACGLTNFEKWAKPYYEIQDLKVLRNVDPSTARGQNMMDAGLIFFADGSALDGTRSWHFKHRTLYCVAPVIANGSAPASTSYDFWAVGTDCCSVASSDFRCGAWNMPHEGVGTIRILDEDATMYYRLAVQQAETLYDLVATHPIFVTLDTDPLREVGLWSQKAFKNYLFFSMAAFVVSLFCIAVASCKFAFIGRGESYAEIDFYNDPDWKSVGYKKSTTGYGSF